VLTSYGTGAIFGCPGHDERDHAFAQRFGLPIVEVVQGGNVEQQAYAGDGPHINSGFLDGLDTAAAKEKIINWLTEQGYGKAKVTYRLRDWLFSRQRYWGEPIPMLIKEDGTIFPVAEQDLPVTLPYLEDISPTPEGQFPLECAQDWVKTIDPETGELAFRETNTMPQWAGSCWYYLRFIDPKNEQVAWDRTLEQCWMPVDLYIGGAEHATLHLLYARFWHKVLYDLGYVSTPEPFQKLFNQGMVLSQSYRDAQGKYYYPYEVASKDGQWLTRDTAEPLETRIEKMSKSKCNVVTPDEVIEEYGADSLRLYEMFLGPLESEVVWQTEQIVGVRRFLERIWRLFSLEEQPEQENQDDNELDFLLNKTIKKVTEDIENLRLNTAISSIMTLVNEVTKYGKVSSSTLEIITKLLSPFAPHIAEEFWQYLGYQDSITYAPWPEYNVAKIVDEQVRIVIQVNGKLRGVIETPSGSTKEDVHQAALSNSQIANYLESSSITRIIFVPDKLLNFVLI